MKLAAFVTSILAGAVAFSADTPKEPPFTVPVVKAKCKDNPGAAYKVHLTFDDGPRIPETEKVLNELKKRGIKATFLISGSHFESYLSGKPTKEAEAFLALLKRMMAEGHTVGSHSYEHIEHAKVADAAKIAENVERNRKVWEKIGPLIGKKNTQGMPFRFPFGAGWFRERNIDDDKQGEKVLKEIKTQGFTPLHWDADTWDWSKIKRKNLPNSVLESICSHEGGVVLMHDIQSFTAENLPAIIDSIQGSGHKLVSYDTIREESRKRSGGPLASFTDKVEGINTCNRPIRDRDQVWKTCEEYNRRSTDLHPLTEVGDM